MDQYEILTYGNPVLRTQAEDVAEVKGALVRTCEAMYHSMLQVNGLGLAAPQVGIQRRFFVYDANLLEGLPEPTGAPQVIFNPRILEASGEWTYMEGCLSVPDMAWDIVRPKELLVAGLDLDGEEVTFEADELFARLIQHEIDHLDGVLLIDHLDADAQRAAKAELNQRLY